MYLPTDADAILHSKPLYVYSCHNSSCAKTRGSGKTLCFGNCYDLSEKTEPFSSCIHLEHDKSIFAKSRALHRVCNRCTSVSSFKMGVLNICHDGFIFLVTLKKQEEAKGRLNSECFYNAM
jgi:hypothetical protein